MKTEMTFKASLLVCVFIAIGLSLPAQEGLAPTLIEDSSTEGTPFGPKVTPQAPTTDDSQVIITSLTQLVIKKQDEQITPLAEEITTGQIPAASALVAQLTPLLHRPLTERGFNFLIEMILSHYDNQDRPVVDVIVPEQDISKGGLTLEVLEGKVGTIGLKKSKWFRREFLASALQTKSGDLIRGKTLQRDLDWLSRNPFRQASLFASPGDGPAVADFLIGLQEQRPWRAFTGYQNTGTNNIGADLFSFGFNWGNAFGQDHLLNYQFTTGDTPSDFRAHSFAWEIPLHAHHHFLRFGGTTAALKSRVEGISSDSDYRELSLALGRPLDRWHGFKQEATLGVEWKKTDNFATFGGFSLPGAEVTLWQFHASYKATGEFKNGPLQLTTDLILNPGTGSDRDFQQFRNGADSQYFLLRTSSRWETEIQPDWTLKLSIQGQYSPDLLLPSEQFGLGGFRTIRGHSERDFLADSGFALSAEVTTPAISIQSLQIRGVTFLDHGTGWRHGEDRQTLTGAGLGLRIEAGQTLNGRIDWAASPEGEQQWHLGFLISF